MRDKKDYPKFRKWITDKQEFSIVCDYIYIVEGKQSCYKCGKSTRVIGFGVENYFEFVDTDDEEESYYYEEGEYILYPILNLCLKGYWNMFRNNIIIK